MTEQNDEKEARSILPLLPWGICWRFTSFPPRKRIAHRFIHILAEQMQEVTGASVALARVDQGDTGSTAAATTSQHEIQLDVVKLSTAEKGFVLYGSSREHLGGLHDSADSFENLNAFPKSSLASLH